MERLFHASENAGFCATEFGMKPSSTMLMFPLILLSISLIDRNPAFMLLISLFISSKIPNPLHEIPVLEMQSGLLSQILL